jgi:hypothetical protein
MAENIIKTVFEMFVLAFTLLYLKLNPIIISEKDIFFLAKFIHCL